MGKEGWRGENRETFTVNRAPKGSAMERKPV